MKVLEQRTKVVVRHLPPSLSEDAFKASIQEWLDSTDWSSYYQGKLSAKQRVYSRAYLNFKDPEDVLKFNAAYDGGRFASDRGAHMRPNVEYAPFQRVPRTNTRRDLREGTIEKDPDYKAFLKSLEEEPQPVAVVAASDAVDVIPAVTPLVQFLRDKRAKEKSKEKSKVGASANASKVTGKTVVVKKAAGKAGMAGRSSAAPPSEEVQLIAKHKKAGKAVQAHNRKVGKDGKAAAISPDPPAAKPGAVAAGAAKPSGPAGSAEGPRALAGKGIKLPRSQKNVGKASCSAGPEAQLVAVAGAGPAQPHPTSKPKPRKTPVPIQVIKRPAAPEITAGKAVAAGATAKTGAPHSTQAEPGGAGAQPAPAPKGSAPVPGGKALGQVPKAKRPVAILRRGDVGEEEGAGAVDAKADPAPAPPAKADALGPGRAPRQARVREGFQAFQPRRAGRLLEGGEEGSLARGGAEPEGSEDGRTPRTILLRRTKPVRESVAATPRAPAPAPSPAES